MKPLLSILIASIPERHEQFSAISINVLGQAYELHERNRHRYVEVNDEYKGVEVITDNTTSFLNGGLSIGKKRQSLLERSEGKYICYLDDDESIAPNFLEVLYDLCKEDKDVCTFKNISKLQDFWCIMDMSLEHMVNQQATQGIIKRTPWHVCPVKREHAILYLFPDSNYGEDWTWFSQVLAHCKTEARSEAIIHQYNHKQQSEADRANENQNQSL